MTRDREGRNDSRFRGRREQRNLDWRERLMKQPSSDHSIRKEQETLKKLWGNYLQRMRTRDGLHSRWEHAGFLRVCRARERVRNEETRVIVDHFQESLQKIIEETRLTEMKLNDAKMQLRSLHSTKPSKSFRDIVWTSCKYCHKRRDGFSPFHSPSTK